MTTVYRFIFGAVIGLLAQAAGDPPTSSHPWLDTLGVIAVSGVFGIALAPWLVMVLSDDEPEEST